MPCKLGKGIGMYIYVVERYEEVNQQVALLLDLETRRIEQKVVDTLYDLPTWVQHRFPYARRVSPQTFTQELAKHECHSCGKYTVEDVNGEPADMICEECFAGIERQWAERDAYLRSFPIWVRATWKIRRLVKDIVFPIKYTIDHR